MKWLHSEEVDRLAEEGASALSDDPRRAIARLEEAHGLACKDGNLDAAAQLSTLLARAWSRHPDPSLAKSLQWARRATRERTEKGSYYTLGHFCEVAASRTTQPTKRRRRGVLFCFAARAYRCADPQLAQLAEDCERAAMEVLDAPDDGVDGRSRPSGTDS